MALPQDYEALLAHIMREALRFLLVHNQISEAGGHSRSPQDKFLAGATKNALTVCLDYLALARAGRYSSAMKQHRLQLDNCMRLYAGRLVEDRQELVKLVLADKASLHMYVGRDGKHLKDSYLSTRLDGRDAWVQKLYTEGSGYIHLTRRQVDLAVGHLPDPDEGKGKWPIPIEAEDRHVEEKHWWGSALLFLACTRLFREQLEEWLEAAQNSGPGG